MYKSFKISSKVLRSSFSFKCFSSNNRVNIMKYNDRINISLTLPNSTSKTLYILNSNATFEDLFQKIRDDSEQIEKIDLTKNQSPVPAAIGIDAFIKNSTEGELTMSINDLDYSFNDSFKEINKPHEKDPRKAIEQLMNEITQTPKDRLTFRELKSQMIHFYQILGGSTYIESELSKNMLRIFHLKEELIQLENTKLAIDKRLERNKMIFFGSMLFLLIGQFSVSYYAIYQVSWLGWDIIEPLTYSLNQGLFIFLFWIYLKYAKDTHTAEFSSVSLIEKIRRKMYLKSGFNLEYYKGLQEELNNLENYVILLEDLNRKNIC